MAETIYGEKGEGTSRFIIVAPHGAGDDWATEKVAKNIAKTLGSYFVINKKFVMSKKSKKALPDGSNIEDFNKLPVSDSGYDWNKKKPEMKSFFDDIQEFQDSILGKGMKPVVIYIHGMKNLGIDIGGGFKYDKKILKGTKEHSASSDNTGEEMINKSNAEKLKEILEEPENKKPILKRWKVGIGARFPGWSRENAIQYHAKTKAESFQLEITGFLRGLFKRKETSKSIADAIRKIYGK